MAQFQSDIQGHRGQASRLGSKASGITANVRSWEGQITVAMWHNERENCDYVSIYSGPHGTSAHRLYVGKVSEIAKGGAGLVLQHAMNALEKECA